MTQKTKLSVNINKLATLRNARGENNPDLLFFVRLIESCNCAGITVHPRPDERHIKKSDIFLLKKHIKGEFNIEGFPSDDFIDLILEIKPHQVTLVPDPPYALTSHNGFTKKDENFLCKAISELKTAQSRISIFINPLDFIDGDIDWLKDIKCNRVELYTKPFIDSINTDEFLKIKTIYSDFGKKISKLNIGINAGHDLSQKNLQLFLRSVDDVLEVSIGHALICEALIDGMTKTVESYLKILDHI